MYEYALAHHGIKGQRWGVRRYQYENGSYTEEGKRRYNRGLSPKQRYKDMTDDEVAARLKRRKNELELDKLEYEASLPAGARFVSGVAKSGLSKGLPILIAGTTVAVGKRYMEHYLDSEGPWWLDDVVIPVLKK